MHETFFPTLFRRLCCLSLFFVASSASFSGFYQKWHFKEASVSGYLAENTFEGMVDGTAYRPFVYRRLLPDTANFIDRMTPQSIRNWLYVHQRQGAYFHIFAISNSPTANSPVYFYRYLIVYILTFGFSFLAVCSMFLLCKACGSPEPVAVFAPVILILVFPYLLTRGGYSYDYSELALFTLAVWMALKLKWWWLIPIALLGAWNKESFFFMPTLYPLLRLRSSRLSALSGAAVLSSGCLIVYWLVRASFAHNPGGAVDFGLVEQIRFLTHPRILLFGTEETFGIRMFSAFTPIPMVLAIWMIVRGWKHLPRVIQKHGKLALAINIPLYFLFCNPGELRNLSMLYVVLLLALAENLNRWMRTNQVDVPASKTALAL